MTVGIKSWTTTVRRKGCVAAWDSKSGRESSCRTADGSESRTGELLKHGETKLSCVLGNEHVKCLCSQEVTGYSLLFYARIARWLERRLERVGRSRVVKRYEWVVCKYRGSLGKICVSNSELKMLETISLRHGKTSPNNIRILQNWANVHFIKCDRCRQRWPKFL